jgi:hypothetical protein
MNNFLSLINQLIIIIILILSFYVNQIGCKPIGSYENVESAIVLSGFNPRFADCNFFNQSSMIGKLVESYTLNFLL